jgi:hypothetical protein
MVLVPNGRTIDALTQGDWEKTGVAPDVEAPADRAPDVAMRLAFEALMAKATTEEARGTYRELLDKRAFLAEHGVPDERQLRAYTGQYGIRRVFLESGRLKIQRQSGPPVDLEPVAEHTFELNIAMTPKPRVRFEVEDGVAAAIVLRQFGGEERVEKDR